MKKNNNKHIIWSNMNLNLDDWKEDLLEDRKLNELDTNVPDYVLVNDMYELNSMYLDDERDNLNVTPTKGRIVCIADLGLWNGRKPGYKLLGHNIGDCLSDFSQAEGLEFYCDRYDFKSIQVHHDGINYLVYREIKSEYTSDQIDNFLWKIYNGKATQKDITRYTKSLKERIKKIYGWN